MNVITLFDIVSLVALWWTAAAALEGGNEVDSWSRAALALSLIGVQVSSILGALAMFAHPVDLPWWTRGILYSGTLFAAWFYERRFGILRHGRMVRDCIASHWRTLVHGPKGRRSAR